MSNLKRKPPRRGTYTLTIYVPEERTIKIGGLGVRKFKAGYYLYTGSAMGCGSTSLDGRISRHLRKEKSLRWHIDYLLAERDIIIKSIVMIESEKRLECKVNSMLRNELDAEIIPKFGSSDCKGRCGSHLIYAGKSDPTNKVGRVYGKIDGSKPIILKVKESMKLFV